MGTPLQIARRVMKELASCPTSEAATPSTNDINDRNDQRGESPRAVGNMTLDEFAQSGRVARIESAVLGCVILLAADNANEAAVASSEHVVYRASELRRLEGVTPEHLRLIHETKTRFEGEVVG